MKVIRNRIAFKCEVKFGKDCRWNKKYREALENNAEKMCRDIFQNLKEEAKRTGEDAVKYFNDMDAAFIVRYVLEQIDE